MITQHLIPLFQKDLDKLKEEISLYPKDEQLWQIKEGINNSGGNLCLHLTGNLQHFIGAVLGDSGYMRNRDAEFRVKNIPRSKLLEDIDVTRSVVTDALEQLSKNDLQKDYILPVLDEKTNTTYFLIYLLSHLNYHIGQINYHRRIIAGTSKTEDQGE
ncbi:DUF1572 family protein [Agriterribacter sp.]|uniref:DUF1572 family protein n=1 Tax=Agriterribacter sp. TaxID=2821509 RepID=UPI002D032156|nr:DUF1572 family protein [Agriterribacter sp.]HRP55852.1 DUF1572 family protein [Agriterribacter sp.]